MACAPPTRYRRSTPRHRRCRQDDRVDIAAAAAGWRANRDLGHAGDLGGDDAHQQGRGQGGAAAGHIDTDRVERTDQLPQRALLAAVDPALQRLLPMEVADAPGGCLQSLAQFRRDRLQRRFQLFGRNLQMRIVVAVEPAIPLQEGLVAILSDAGDDAAHRFFRGDGLAKQRCTARQHSFWRLDIAQGAAFEQAFASQVYITDDAPSSGLHCAALCV